MRRKKTGVGIISKFHDKNYEILIFFSTMVKKKLKLYR